MSLSSCRHWGGCSLSSHQWGADRTSHSLSKGKDWILFAVRLQGGEDALSPALLKRKKTNGVASVITFCVMGIIS